ncbi:MAG: 50S ribosomal protein L11 methyltransferase [Deltaproteobacteria bacterium]|nr:50S ribosomal protein L11 methyltransferase [Deltaproteobacteria bacterium]
MKKVKQIKNYSALYLTTSKLLAEILPGLMQTLGATHSLQRERKNLIEWEFNVPKSRWRSQVKRWPKEVCAQIKKVTFRTLKNENWNEKFQRSLKPFMITSDIQVRAHNDQLSKPVQPLHWLMPLAATFMASAGMEAFRVPACGGPRLSMPADAHEGPAASARPTQRLHRLAQLIVPYGLAFGTGEHATTQLCAQLLRIVLKDQPGRSLLDVGCGTGILALVGWHYGAKPIVALDNDPEALQVARETLGLNRARRAIMLKKDLTEVSQKFDVIVANILLNPLIELKPLLLQRLTKKGILILSGITYSQRHELERAYSDFKLTKVLNKKGWTALALLSH